jgi:hypothetical protein
MLAKIYIYKVRCMSAQKVVRDRRPHRLTNLDQIRYLGRFRPWEAIAERRER